MSEEQPQIINLQRKDREFQNNLLLQWQNISYYGQAARSSYLRRILDMENLTHYCASLQHLWLDLYPKAMGDTSLKDRFEEYVEAFKQPALLMSKPAMLFELHLLLREALEKLKITVIEEVK